MPDTQISEEMCLRAAVGKRKRQMERTGAGNAFDPTCPPTDNEMDDARAALEAALSGCAVVPRTISDSQLNKALGREEDARITPMFSMFRDFYHNIVAAPPVPEMEG